MSQEINVVLARANWCSHCKHFEPIFEQSKELYKNDSELKNMNIELQQNKGQGYRKVQEQQKNWKRIDVNDLFQKNTKTISNINKLSVDELKKMQ